MGWGSICRVVKSADPWVQTENNKHINQLELLADFKALDSFTENLYNASVELMKNNTSELHQKAWGLPFVYTVCNGAARRGLV